MNQEISWKKFAVEAIVIVGSILLAFAIEALWQVRGDRIEERALLINLRDDFIANQERLHNRNEVIESAIKDLGMFLQMSPEQDGNTYSVEEINSITTAIDRSYMTRGMTHGFINSTINSGKLALISSQELQAAIVETEDNESNLLVIAEDVREAADRSLFELGKYEGPLDGHWADRNFVQTSLSSLREMRSNLILVSAIKVKAQRMSTFVSNQQRLIDHLQRVAELLDQELQNI